MDDNNISEGEGPEQSPFDDMDEALNLTPQERGDKLDEHLPLEAEPPEVVEPVEQKPLHVLPPTKYKLKTAILFSDFFAIILYIYYLMVRSIIADVSNESFSFVSNRMFACYSVLAITLAAAVFVLIFKFTKSAKTRFERANEVRQNPNIKVWLIGYDWGWPILFVPTFVLMAIAGVLGSLANLVFSSAEATMVTQSVIGGFIVVVATLNAAVVIFKLRPVVVALLAGGFFIILMILLLHGAGTFLAFFKGFRHLGVSIEPVGYIMLAYIWSVFLRIIWLKSLFFYWVFVPNRLELQHGLSESNDSVDRDDLRHKIDTDDVILRWWNVGMITYYFPQLDRLPITNVVWGIRKKAVFANRIASVKTMQD